MAGDPERRFLVDPWVRPGKPIRALAVDQGYLADTGGWEVRLDRADGERRLVLNPGAARGLSDWEIPVPAAAYDDLWASTNGRRVSKVRELYQLDGFPVAVDRFAGNLGGLSVALVTPGIGRRPFRVPRDFGPEITWDPRYRDGALAEGKFTAPKAIPPKGLAAGWAYGAVPYRKTSKGWEVVVVSTRRQERWIFPKGQPEPGLTPGKVALTEAKEEAGVSGKIDGHPILLPYTREAGTVNLLLFPVRVNSLADHWLEEAERTRKILSLADAEALDPEGIVGTGVRWLKDLLRWNL